MSKTRLVLGSIFKTSTGLTTIEVTDGSFISNAATSNIWHGEKGGITEHDYEARARELDDIVNVEMFLSFANGSAKIWKDFKNEGILHTNNQYTDNATLRIYTKVGDTENDLWSGSATSGFFQNGLLPNGNYLGRDLDKSSPFEDEQGFKFRLWIDPIEETKKGYNRTAIQIHSLHNAISYKKIIGGKEVRHDGSKNYTNGCIGITSGHESIIKFYDLLNTYMTKGKRIKLNVNIIDSDTEQNKKNRYEN